MAGWRKYAIGMVGLICGEEERESIANSLLKAGVTKVTYAKEMSSMICGEAHDGEYPLRRYSRVVSVDEK